MKTNTPLPTVLVNAARAAVAPCATRVVARLAGMRAGATAAPEAGGAGRDWRGLAFAAAAVAVYAACSFVPALAGVLALAVGAAGACYLVTGGR